MRTKLTFTTVAFMLVAIVPLLLTSCEEHEPEKKSDVFIVVDNEKQTNYDISVVNLNTQSISYMKLNDSYQLESMDVILAESECMFNVNFYENGLVKSIGNSEFALVFSNYSGNTVDVALMTEEEVLLEKAFKGSHTWETGRLNVASKSSNVALETILNTSDFLYDLNEKLTNVKIIGELVEDLVDVSQAGSAASLGKKPFKNFVVELVKFGADIVQIPFDLSESEFSKWIDLADFVLTAKWTVFGVLKELILNYPSYVDLCESMFLKFFEMKDNVYDAIVEHGLAALNSGTGNLKITLSWDFYADIDVVVVEPDGNYIFWKYPYSSSGGNLDFDNRRGGLGSKENVYWENPKDGIYTVALNYYGPSTYYDLSESGICKVTIFYKGVGKVYNVAMTNDDLKVVACISIPSGELTKSSVLNSLHEKFMYPHGEKPSLGR